MSVWIQCIEAKGIPIPSADEIVDPYAMIRLSSSPIFVRTNVIDNETNPEWNQECTFPLVNIATDVIQITIFDRDVFGQDLELAKLEIHISDIANTDIVDKWFDMLPFYPIQNTPCQIHLILKVLNGPTMMNPMMYQQGLIPGQQMMQPQNMMPNPMLLQQSQMLYNGQPQLSQIMVKMNPLNSPHRYSQIPRT